MAGGHVRPMPRAQGEPAHHVARGVLAGRVRHNGKVRPGLGVGPGRGLAAAGAFQSVLQHLLVANGHDVQRGQASGLGLLHMGRRGPGREAAHRRQAIAHGGGREHVRLAGLLLAVDGVHAAIGAHVRVIVEAPGAHALVQRVQQDLVGLVLALDEHVLLAVAVLGQGQDVVLVARQAHLAGRGAGGLAVHQHADAARVRGHRHGLHGDLRGAGGEKKQAEEQAKERRGMSGRDGFGHGDS